MPLLKYAAQEPEELHWTAVVASLAQNASFHVTWRTERPHGCGDAKVSFYLLFRFGYA